MLDCAAMDEASVTDYRMLTYTHLDHVEGNVE